MTKHYTLFFTVLLFVFSAGAMYDEIGSGYPVDEYDEIGSGYPVDEYDEIGSGYPVCSDEDPNYGKSCKCNATKTCSSCRGEAPRYTPKKISCTCGGDVTKLCDGCKGK